MFARVSKQAPHPTWRALRRAKRHKRIEQPRPLARDSGNDDLRATSHCRLSATYALSDILRSLPIAGIIPQSIRDGIGRCFFGYGKSQECIKNEAEPRTPQHGYGDPLAAG